MRESVIKVYEFHELSEKAKQKALEEFSDINVSHDWWDYYYAELLSVGIQVWGFDIDRRSINFKLKDCAQAVWDDIVKEGWGCEIGELAKELKAKYEAFLETVPDSEDWSWRETEEKRKEWFDEELNGFEDSMYYEFTRRLARLILKYLKEDYDHLTSEEAIVETIEANEYEFYEDGKHCWRH